MEIRTWENTPFLISTDPALLDFDAIHRFLSVSYWAKGIPVGIARKSLANSLCFGVYEFLAGKRQQVGFARVISDYATFAYLGDVYVEEPWRGRGLSKWLMSCVTAHPELQGLRRFCLGTRDAHGLYRKYGFAPVAQPENWMEIKVPDIYLRLGNAPEAR